METGPEIGKRTHNQHEPHLARRRASARVSGGLSSGLCQLAGARMGLGFSTLESQTRILLTYGRNLGFGILQSWKRPPKVAYRPPLPLLCGLVHGEWGNAQEGPANGSGYVCRAGAGLPTAGGGCAQGREGRVKAGCARLQPRDGNSEGRTQIEKIAAVPNRGIKQPGCGRRSLLILQSLNQSIRSRSIRESPNQQISQSSLAYAQRDSSLRSSASPVAGRMVEQPTTQATSGGDVRVSASGNFLV